MHQNPLEVRVCKVRHLRFLVTHDITPIQCVILIPAHRPLIHDAIKCQVQYCETDFNNIIYVIMEEHFGNVKVQCLYTCINVRFESTE